MKEKLIVKKTFSNGLPYSLLTYDHALKYMCSIAADCNNPTVVYTPNVHHFYLFSKNVQFREAYNKADVLLLDGMPLVLIARFIHRNRVEKISGSDVFVDLLKMADKKRLKIYLLGGKEGVAETAVRNLGSAGRLGKTIFIDAPTIGFERNHRMNDAVVDKIASVNPNVLFVGLGAPKQELWIYQNAHRLNAGLILGVGGSFDFIAGTTRRAPVWVRKISLEWLFRLVRDPRRLWKRYLFSNIFFIKELLKMMTRKIARLN